MTNVAHLLGLSLMIWLCKSEKLAAIISKDLHVCAPHMGCVQGKYMPGYEIEKFEAYLGIPYALPPVNELRFSSPKSYPKWFGVYDATQPKTECIQKNYLLPEPSVQGVEDCLYLNVYRPVRNDSLDLLPVMVYIHGGGWFSGTASPSLNGPEYFMDTQEVILVTFAYRLGAFGFLSTHDIHMPGNFGLKDQNLALRWVQKNIAAFGGNPHMVTIFGQSAGAISAHMHMLSKQSEGLFHSVIALSGTANVPFAITEDPLAQTRKLAQICNISNAENLSTAKLTRALRHIDAVTLVNAGDGLKYWDVDHMTNFRPVIESASITDAILTQHPEKLLSKGRYKAVPWMAGFVPKEGAVRAVAILENSKLKTSFNDDFDYLLEQLMELPKHYNETRLNHTVRSIIDEYFQGRHILEADNEIGLLDSISDRGFLSPFYNAIETYVNTINTTKHPVYLYNFDYRGKNTFATIYTGGIPKREYGTVHCDDLIYLFRSPVLFADFQKNSTDAAVMRAFVGNFIHFAKTGKPFNAAKMQNCNRINFQNAPICDYQKFTNAESNSFEVRIEDSFPVERVQFWNNLLAD